MSDSLRDHRVYADLNILIRLQAYAKRFNFLPNRAINRNLAGPHVSRLRGRGLSFEELRGYRIGDDIRTLDWKVTNRTGKPHVRVFCEEREREVLLLVDQRSQMFFGSKLYMKSVVAAETAALAMWHFLSVKDKVGALVFNDHDISTVKPRRSRKTAMQILHNIVRFNHQLAVSPKPKNIAQLQQVLRQAERLCSHDCLLVLISDLHDWDQQTLQQLKRIRAHNDVIVSLVHDPLEQALPETNKLIISDGQLQVDLSQQATHLRKNFSNAYFTRLDKLQAELSKQQIPLVLLDTATPAHQQTLGPSSVENNVADTGVES